MNLLFTIWLPDGVTQPPISAPYPLELVMCHWFGIGVGFVIRASVAFWTLTFPSLATNPLINSSPTSGLAQAVGREARFTSELSSAVATVSLFSIGC